MATSIIRMDRIITGDTSFGPGCTIEEYGGIFVIQFNGYEAVDAYALVGGRWRPQRNVFNVMTDESGKTPVRVGITTSGQIAIRSIATGGAVASALLTGQISYRVTPR